MARRHRSKAPVEPLTHDPNPLFAVRREGNRFVHWMAFDPKYGAESEAQITWHIAAETPGAEAWQVHTPAPPFA